MANRGANRRHPFATFCRSICPSGVRWAMWFCDSVPLATLQTLKRQAMSWRGTQKFDTDKVRLGYSTRTRQMDVGTYLRTRDGEYGQRTEHNDEYRFDGKVRRHLHRDSRFESRNQPHLSVNRGTSGRDCIGKRGDNGGGSERRCPRPLQQWFCRWWRS